MRDRALVLLPGEGRQFSLGSIQLCFKADQAESEGRYSTAVAAAEPEPGRRHTSTASTTTSAS